jgi:exopolysaccharide biosynthesis polyprenyl glycosylphosphotransferase
VIRRRRLRVAVLSPGVAAALAVELKNVGVRSHEIVGWLEADGQAFSTYVLPGGGPYLGQLDDVREIVRRHRIDLLVSCPVHGDDRTRLRVLEAVAESCLDLPVRMIELGELYEELLGHVPIGAIDASWFQGVLDPRFKPESEIAKRAFDLVLGSIGLLLSLPLLAVAAVAIKLSDRGPLLYRQARVGRYGVPFTMLKLRSMRVDAEASGRVRTSPAGDPRVTPVGRYLRRWHIDELPQLLNVLRGEMSLVGPRPEQPALVPGLEARFRYYRYRHLLKPGITGWGQVRCGYAGTEIGAAWKLCHDLFYLKHRSLFADARIVAKTFLTVLHGVQYGLRTPDEHFIADERAHQGGLDSVISAPAAPAGDSLVLLPGGVR